MNVIITGFNYNFDVNQEVTYVQVTFGSTNTNGEYVNAQVKVVADDLSGKDFGDMTMSQLQDIARNKLKEYIAASVTAPTDVSTKGNTVTAD